MGFTESEKAQLRFERRQSINLQIDAINREIGRLMTKRAGLEAAADKLDKDV